MKGQIHDRSKHTREVGNMTRSNQIPVGCACCAVSRRGFLASACATACGISAAGSVTLSSATARANDASSGKRVRVIFALHEPVQPSPDWPNVRFDFRPVMESRVNLLRQAMPRVEFIISTARNEEETAALLKDDAGKPVDGYVVFQLNCWNRVIQKTVETGKPVLYVDFQYGGSGGFLVYTAALTRAGSPNLGFVASSNPDDLAAALGCFEKAWQEGPQVFGPSVAAVRKSRTVAMGNIPVLEDPLKPRDTAELLERLNTSKILAYLDENTRTEAPWMDRIALEYRPFAELNAAHQQADRDHAAEIARKWRKTALGVHDVADETLLESAAFYLGMKSLLEKHGANAITINCLGGFYGNHIHAYPCLGFHELCNDGIVGACECDVRSTATMLTFSAMASGRTGFISDPVIDTSKGQIIYAHCVASNRPLGPEGPANPFYILTHSEDRQGAAVRSILPTGFTVTTMELGPDRKEILFHQGVAVANDPDDRACRTKLAVAPKGDLEKLFTMWDTYGWHRVTAYGDLRESVFALADALGWKVYEEA